jgi:redox-sensitive bicupin YhaK (pirin superfamily)
MITLRPARERGHAQHGWLDSWHTFSFAEYHDPRHMGFASLRVINDDTVLGGAGFDLHPHRDMEILTYVLSGALQHRDSLGHSAVIPAGDLQRISAGTGVSHSEFNHSPIEPVHFLQIWILPDQKGVKPDYAQKTLARTAGTARQLVASKTGRAGSLRIHQDADVWLGRLETGGRLDHVVKPGRCAWLHVAEGGVALNGSPLRAGDGAALRGEGGLALTAGQESQVLLFDMIE